MIRWHVAVQVLRHYKLHNDMLVSTLSFITWKRHSTIARHTISTLCWYLNTCLFVFFTLKGRGFHFLTSGHFLLAQIVKGSNEDFFFRICKKNVKVSFSLSLVKFLKKRCHNSHVVTRFQVPNDWLLESFGRDAWTRVGTLRVVYLPSRRDSSFSFRSRLCDEPKEGKPL